MSAGIAELERPLRVIQLREAFYCVDCEAISSGPVQSCPACTSSVLLPLGPMLGVHVEENEAQSPLTVEGSGI